MKDNNLRFRSKVSPILHLASWIAYLYASYCLNESKFGSGFLVIVIFPLYAVSFYSIFFFFKFLIQFRKPLQSACGLLAFLILILPLTYLYIHLLLLVLGIQMQDSSVAFSWKEFAQSTYLGVFRIGIYAFIAFLISHAFKGKRLRVILNDQIKRLKFGMLGIQLSSHTQFDLLHKLMGRFEGDREEFEQYVEWLADIQGYTATGVDRSLVPLRAEIDQTCHLALMLEPAYFSENSDWLEILGEIDNVQIPPMILVSLLENACKYTDFGKPNTIKMKVRALDDILLIFCENTMGSERAHKSLGLGNNNLKARLDVLFGHRAYHRSFQRKGRYEVQISIHFDKTETTNKTT